MHLLVTGGAGYIGSHMCLRLLEHGDDVTVIDNLCNSAPEALRRVQQMAGRKLRLVVGDVRDGSALQQALTGPHKVDAVLHFAGLKAAGASVALPVHYYASNVAGSLQLLEAMQAQGVQTLVFSSSATVYGAPLPEHLPLTESAPCGSTQNPYASSKWMVERCLADLQAASPDWRIACLRYFNPVGAHASGRLGEHPIGVPNNLMPFISQVASGRRAQLSIFGADYPTADGTCVRDYLHVMDLVEGHMAALQYLRGERQGGMVTVNLGTGRGYSVLEMVRAFEAANGLRIPFRIEARRPGDVPAYFADATRARQLLGWRATRSLHDMCVDSWRWQRDNPDGYTERHCGSPLGACR